MGRARRVFDAVAIGYRERLVQRAEDRTAMAAERATVVFAPHPDDETLACGGTIARKTHAGTPVSVVIATDGTASHPNSRLSASERAAMRRDEARAAVAALGVDVDQPGNLVFLDHPDGRLGDHTSRLTDQMAEVLDDRRPTEIYVPSAIDWNDDHRVMSAAARRLVARRYVAATVYEYPVWFYEPWSWVDRSAGHAARFRQLTGRPLRALFSLRPSIVRTGEYAIIKEQALAHYRSQMTNITGEPDWAVLPEEFLRRQLAAEEIFFEPVRDAEGRNRIEVER